jgi:hypothetical protein
LTGEFLTEMERVVLVDQRQDMQDQLVFFPQPAEPQDRLLVGHGHTLVPVL